MNKNCEQHLEELIDFYSKTELSDVQYLKKLFVRNLKDVQRRYVKYDKPNKDRISKALKYIDQLPFKDMLPMEVQVIKALLLGGTILRGKDE